MFVARAGLTGRVLRQNRTSGLAAILGPTKKKKEKGKFRCWVPFMLYPCLAGLAGFLVLLGGASMCVVGYYAEHFASTEISNETHTWIEIRGRERAHLHNLTYGGPVMMGCGCFIIVVSCVVVCEQRDKMIKIMIEEEEKKKRKRGYKPPPKKENIIERIVNKIKQCSEQSIIAAANKQEDSEVKSHWKLPCTGLQGSPKSVDYSNISSALRRIPMEIFTIDMEQERKTSLIPVQLTYSRNSHASRERSKSAPCLGDLKWKQLYLKTWINQDPEKIRRELMGSPECSDEEEDSYNEDNDGVVVDDEERIDISDDDGDEVHTDDNFLQSTCDTKDTYIQLRLHDGDELDSSSHVIVHQASVHNSDAVLCVDPKHPLVTDSVEQLTCGVARTNAIAMDKPRKMKNDLFLSDKRIRELAISDEETMDKISLPGSAISLNYTDNDRKTRYATSLNSK